MSVISKRMPRLGEGKFKKFKFEFSWCLKGPVIRRCAVIVGFPGFPDTHMFAFCLHRVCVASWIVETENNRAG